MLHCEGMDFTNKMWEKVREGIDAMGDMLLEAFDKTMSFATSKFKELAGSVGSSAAEGMRGAKSSISNAIAPNSIGKAKSDPSPSTDIGPAKSPEVSPSQPTQDYGKMLQSSGFSAETLGNLDIGASDLGHQASVGVDGVGCAAQTTAATVTQTYELTR